MPRRSHPAYPCTPALDLPNSPPPPPERINQDLVARYLKDLMAKGEFKLAAEECPRLLEGDPTAWERWIYGFARMRRLPAVVPFVPIKDPRLPASVYEVVLEHLLLNEPRLFLETMRRYACLCVGWWFRLRESSA